MFSVSGIFARYPLIRYIASIFGIIEILCFAPFMGITMGIFVLWFIFINNSKEKSIIFHPESLLSKYCSRYYSQFVRYKQDVFVLNVIIIEGIFLPFLFFLILFITKYIRLKFYQHFLLWHFYSFIRIGPASMHFAYSHTLMHKEGHTKLGIFKFSSKILNFIFNNCMNWWISMFYGVMPGTYAFGHSVNHHSFNNLEGDLVSTGWGKRDNIFNFFAFLIQWTLYHINITSLYSFYNGPKRMRKYTKNMIFGVTYYWFFIFSCLSLSGYNYKFIFFYLIYPMFEGMIFLAMVNWSWHSFVDPNNFENEYVASLTIFNGPSNVLNEDYHVVHHQYPAHHWTTHPNLFLKHKQEYINNKASVFQQTHAVEIFYFGVTRQYKKIAQKYNKEFLPKNMSEKELIDLIKTRLRTTFFDENRKYKLKS